MDQEIRIKLTVDGKEANTVLQLSNDLFEAIVQKANAYNVTTTGAGISAKSFASDTNAMNQVLAQFGSMISNSDVFLESFKGSMDLIADNLPGLVMGFVNAGKEAGSMGTSVGKMLVGSLTGTGGLMLALEGVSLLLKVLPSLFGDTTEEAGKTKVKLDDLTESANYIESGFTNIKKEIRELSFDDLADKYDKLIISINESENNLNKSSIWSRIWQGLTLKPLTETLGFTVPLQDWFEGEDTDIRKKLDQQKEATAEIKNVGETLKKYLTGGYTAEKLLTISPKDRKEIGEYLEQILNDWPEAQDVKGIRLTQNLRNIMADQALNLGGFRRKNVENLLNTINRLNSKKSDSNKFANENIKAAAKTHEDKLNDNLNYYDELLKEHLEYLQEYKNYLNVELEYYKAHVKEKGGINKLSREELASNNEAENRVKALSKYDLDTIKPAQFKSLLSDIPKQLSPLNDLTALRNEAGGYENKKQTLEDWYNNAIEKYKEDLANHKTTTEEKALIDQIYYSKLNDLNDKYLLTTTKILDGLTNQFAVSFGNIYSYAEKNANNEINTWKKKEDKKIEEERKAALAHAKNQKQREKINEEFDKKQEALENQAQTRAKEKLFVWFRLKQLGDISTATMSTYKAATSALEPSPVGLGPIWGWPLMAAVIAGGLANVAMIASQKMPGYKRGGAIVGEDGPEIIAPFQDYASGQSKLITMTMMTLRDEIRSGRATGSMSASISNMGNLETAITRLNKRLDEGIDARAYLDDRQAKRIYNRGSAQNRRSKI